MYPPSLSPDQRYFEELVRDGISAAKSGNRPLAQKLLLKATTLNSGDARPWLWLSGTTDDPAERRLYIERAVAAEPGNATARRAMAMLSDKLDKSRLMEEGASYQPQPPAEPEETPGEAVICPSAAAG